MGKNVMNERELELLRDAIETHLHLLTDLNEERLNPETEDRMRQFRALLERIKPK